MASSDQKMTRMALTAMVVGGMVGAGHLLAPPDLCERHRSAGRGHRLAHRRHRHVHAGARVPGAGRAQARPRRRRLRLRQGRLRRLSRAPVGVRLLDRQLHRQRLVLGADQVDAGRVLPGLRRRQHGDRDRGGLDRHLAVPLPDPARRAAGRGHQQDRHHRQGHPDPGVHRHPVRRLQDGAVPLQPVRRRPDQRPVRAGQGDDAGDGVRVHRHRGRQRLFALRQGARATSAGPPSSASSASPA